MKRVSRLFIIAVSIALGITACTNATAPASAPAATGGAAAASDADKQWTMPNKNQSATRYSAVE